MLGTGLPGLGIEHLPGALCSGTGSPVWKDKGNVNQAGCFGYSLVEMAFVVGQGVIRLLGRYRGWKVLDRG